MNAHLQDKNTSSQATNAVLKIMEVDRNRFKSRAALLYARKRKNKSPLFFLCVYPCSSVVKFPSAWIEFY